MGRVEPHGVGSIMHILKRGTRGMKIVRDMADRDMFERSLFYLNEEHQDENWKRNTAALGKFERPDSWPERQPLVDILAWTLLSNHFHLLVRERVERGLAKFMQRLGNSMSSSYNKKYDEKGSLFQGSYKGKIVHDDTYLRQLVGYILVKNTFELYPGGIAVAARQFDKAWRWGLEYPYSSFGVSATGKRSPVLCDEEGLVASILTEPHFKRDAKDLLIAHAFTSDELKALALESWD